MMSALSSSFRALALYNTLMPKITIAIFTIHIRDVHLGQQIHRQSLEEKLDLPKKPKRPPSSFILYLTESRPEIVAKNPKLKSTEIYSMLSKRWSSLDDSKKQIYQQQYNKQLLKYKSVKSEYDRNLTEEHKIKIKEMKLTIAERKAALAQKAMVRELGKPKKPQSPFTAYLKVQKDRGPKEAYRDFLKRVSLKWYALSEVEKQKYKTPQAMDSYLKALSKWESHMMKLGNYDVIREKTLKNQGKHRSESLS